MKIRFLAFAACLAFCLIQGGEAFSQTTIQYRTPGNDSVKVVIIRNANTYHFEKKDSLTNLSFWAGGVVFEEGKTIIHCDSMISNDKEHTIESFGHVHINDNDSTDIYSDYMKYQLDKKTIYFQKNVKLTDGKGVLTTQELQYDLNTKVGVYNHGGKVVNKESVLTSEQGTYYEATKDVYFQKNVVLKDPQYDLFSDSLLYNTQTQVSTFITETNILFKDSTHRTVKTRDGYYDLRNRKAYFGKRPIITDGSQRITGDTIQFDDSTGISIARGHAVYKDTSQGAVIIANLMYTSKKTNTFLATQSPLMIIKQDKDSIYISADTFYSGRLSDLALEERNSFIQDSLHKHYLDSLLQRSSDSLHRISTDSLHDKPDSSSPLTDGLHGNHPISVKDESHKIHPDSVQEAPAVPRQYTQAYGDSVREAALGIPRGPAGDSTRRPALARDSAQGALARASLKRAKAADSLLAVQIRDSLGAAAKTGGIQPKEKDSVRDKLRDNAQVKPGTNAADTVKAVTKTPAPDSTKAIAVYNPRNNIRGRSPDNDTGSNATVSDTSLRYIKGFHHVRIFSDSLQAVADSMYYSGKDSIFRLYKDPIAWGNGQYQVTGDTMFVYTKNKKADRLYVFENGLAINKVGPNFYNQIKGTTINAYFKDGVMDFMRAKGNAESIYYVRNDNKKYTGVNKAHADIIDMIFVKKELDRVVLRNDAEGSMIPFKKVNFDDMRLRGFKWQEDRRPKTKFELFESEKARTADDQKPKETSEQ